MSAAADAPSEPLLDPQAAAPGPLAATRPFYWSVRRELWENRSVYLAPLSIAVVVLFGFLLGSAHVASRMRAAALGDAKQADALMTPYSFAALAIMLTGLLVAVFYSLAALHAERRDRSILFWKSLPVSDLVTVLSKAAIPSVVIPVVTFAVIFAAQLVMLAWSLVVALASGVGPAVIGAHEDLTLMWIVLPYGLVVMALWNAPIFAWLLLVSAWARRIPILWALITPIVPAIVERVAFGTSHFARFLAERLFGGFGEAFSIGGHGQAAIQRLDQVDPGRVLANPELWFGLILAAALLAAAIWLRRRREPI